MAEIGRNDPCPCGSGKKYKKCCERKTLKGFVASSQVASSSEKTSKGIFSIFKKSLSEIPQNKKAPEAKEKEESSEKKIS